MGKFHVADNASDAAFAWQHSAGDHRHIRVSKHLNYYSKQLTPRTRLHRAAIT